MFKRKFVDLQESLYEGDSKAEQTAKAFDKEFSMNSQTKWLGKLNNLSTEYERKLSELDPEKFGEAVRAGSNNQISERSCSSR